MISLESLYYTPYYTGIVFSPPTLYFDFRIQTSFLFIFIPLGPPYASCYLSLFHLVQLCTFERIVVSWKRPGFVHLMTERKLVCFSGQIRSQLVIRRNIEY